MGGRACWRWPTIKPQLVALVILWLAIWVLGKWRERQALLWSFAASMVVLVVAGEIVAARAGLASFDGPRLEYYRYTGGGRSFLDVALTPPMGTRNRRGPIVGVVFVFRVASPAGQ